MSKRRWGQLFTVAFIIVLPWSGNNKDIKFMVNPHYLYFLFYDIPEGNKKIATQFHGIIIQVKCFQYW